MDAVVEVLSAHHVEGSILDPFAGTGRIHELRERFAGWDTLGVELEPEWADMSPYTVAGDATQLPPEWTALFQAVVTSPPYGNRMADAYAGDSSPCPECPTHTGGMIDAWCVCKACKGTGTVSSRRHTYRIALQRPLTDGSAAGMQWGDKYRDTMHRALAEVYRVLVPGGMFLLNISDHVRAGVLQRVPEWYSEAVRAIGFIPVDVLSVGTPRMRMGANSDLRAESEFLLVYRKPLSADKVKGWSRIGTQDD